jgi:hypothetical protein
MGYEETYDPPLPFPVAAREWLQNEAAQRTRNVLDLRIKDLVPDSTTHRRREAVVIDGQPVKETLRERLTRESLELENAVMVLANQLAKRAEQLEHLNRFPEEDPFDDGTTLQFEKSFPHTPNATYSYAAHKVDGRWYLTGARSPQALTWDAFISWMGLGVSEVYKLGGKGGRRKVIG